MTYSIRVMERTDVAAVGALLRKVYGERSALYANWDEILEWMYFSPAIADPAPRALVIADQTSVVGHIGWTVSEFTDGEQRFSVVQTENWAVDPACRVGLLALRLMQQAMPDRESAIVIGGSEYTQRIVPKLGFQRRGDVDRYLKVLKPFQYLFTSRSGERLARNFGKLMVCMAHSLPRLEKVNGKGSPAAPRAGTNGCHHGCHSNLRPGETWAARPGVLRNTVDDGFLNWYQRCPEGRVHVLNFYREGRTILGRAAMLIREGRGKRYANLLNVDAPVDDPTAWGQILNSVESFLIGKGVTHINTLASFEPWRQALRAAGYSRVSRFPFWVRDKGNRWAGASAWHLTLIEGDLGYLLE